MFCFVFKQQQKNQLVMDHMTFYNPASAASLGSYLTAATTPSQYTLHMERLLSPR